MRPSGQTSSNRLRGRSGSHVRDGDPDRVLVSGLALHESVECICGKCLGRLALEPQDLPDVEGVVRLARLLCLMLAEARDGKSSRQCVLAERRDLSCGGVDDDSVDHPRMPLAGIGRTHGGVDPVRGDDPVDRV